MLVTISSERVKRPYENFQGTVTPLETKSLTNSFSLCFH